MLMRGLYESTKSEAVDTEADNIMPAHNGKKKPMGKKKPKKNGKKRKGLTAKQKKLPPALQKAILKKMKG
ncbi:MAG: hypothetical protein CBB97_22140 [Candidatus Endolissoclinum sp. TMED37]|nr:MAG: hypothetical protein CBB97_22140 [Candidatus Endolissoclinum sp. TMED37]